MVGCYLIGMLRPVAPLIEFELNKGYIQDVLCINKDKPITVCGGSCYLSNRMEQEAANAKASPQVNMQDYPVAIIDLVAITLQPGYKRLVQWQPFTVKAPASFHTDIFHPPL